MFSIKKFKSIYEFLASISFYNFTCISTWNSTQLRKSKIFFFELPCGWKSIRPKSDYFLLLKLKLFASYSVFPQFQYYVYYISTSESDPGFKLMDFSYCISMHRIEKNGIKLLDTLFLQLFPVLLHTFYKRLNIKDKQ